MTKLGYKVIFPCLPPGPGRNFYLWLHYAQHFCEDNTSLKMISKKNPKSGAKGGGKIETELGIIIFSACQIRQTTRKNERILPISTGSPDFSQQKLWLRSSWLLPEISVDSCWRHWRMRTDTSFTGFFCLKTCWICWTFSSSKVFRHQKLVEVIHISTYFLMNPHQPVDFGGILDL